MNDVIRTALHLIRQRIEQLHGECEENEEFQEGLNFAVSGIEQALGAVGGEHVDDTPPEGSINDIENSLAELHIRLETRSDAWIDDPAMRTNLPLADHLLAQACALLADD